MDALPTPPQAFICVADARTARETALEAGRVTSVSDPISEAAWLVHEASGEWWTDLWRGKRRRIETNPGLAPPFDREGGDALGLMEPGSPFRPEGEALRAWRGVIQANGRGIGAAGETPPLVLRDTWATGPDWRVTEMCEFELRSADGQRVVVRCRKAPLVIARPFRMTAQEAQQSFHPVTLRELRKRTNGRQDDETWVITLRAGDTVDVLGIDAGAEFVVDAGGGYRTMAGVSLAVIGDQPDVRLVLAKIP